MSMKDKQFAYCAKTWEHILNQAIYLEENACTQFFTSNFQIDSYNMKAMKEFRAHLEQAINVAFEACNLHRDTEFEPEI